MLKVAGRVCDGVRLHGFATRKYVEEVCLPKLAEGLALGFGDEVDRNLVSEILQGVKRIDSPFEGHLTDW